MAKILWVDLQAEGEVALHRAAKAAAAAQGLPLRQWIFRAMAAQLGAVPGPTSTPEATGVEEVMSATP